MDNLLPEFTAIKANEPSSTQTLAQFSVTLARTQIHTPPSNPISSTGVGVISDLLLWKDAERLQLDDNRLIGSDPVPFEKRPEVHDPMKGQPMPYADEARDSPPVNEANRGSPLKVQTTRVYKVPPPESPKGDGIHPNTANVCFIHTVTDSPSPETEDAGSVQITSDPDRFYGPYDMFLKSGSSSISHGEISKGGKFNFSTNGTKAEGDMKAGVTFSLVKDDFTKGHFDMAMQTGLFGTRKEQQPSEGAGEGQIEISAEVTKEEFDLRGEEFVGEEPKYMGGEFVVAFQKGTLGMELEEVEGCVKVRQIVEGGQASSIPHLKVGTIVVGVEGFPITSLDDLNQVFEALEEVNPEAERRLHFLGSIEEGSAAPETTTPPPESEPEQEPAQEEFFLTGTGHEEDELLAARQTANTNNTNYTAQTPVPPPPLPPLPLSLQASVDDTKPITIYFQNKHASMALRVCWIDYSGELVPRKELHPGESYMERSFSSHPWVCTAVEFEASELKDDSSNAAAQGMGMFTKQDTQDNVAPEVSPAIVMRLGDVAASALKSYTTLWDPSARSMSFMPQTKISAGRVRPSMAPENAKSGAARVAFARAQVVQQLRDARLDPLGAEENGLGAGTPNLVFMLFGNSQPDYRSVFAA
ncbi:hypothetical protein TrST_g853 [Triparma strigata]|uniref:PDZ domain-containing protein n=1 Tax=Triparma strigata TaxID=1606541 RepID=A0A9W7BEN1_9STRA|nr:hypothetical protein TrST_g853 [Triparma strigata]